jgi:hypothetical protein
MAFVNRLFRPNLLQQHARRLIVWVLRNEYDPAGLFKLPVDLLPGFLFGRHG